ncbi:oxidoreductase [Actinoplanes lobatus]|uniref:Oxidoreductase n=1 Tax=Actinoplanes lobatus TaxID=113568 RepID=A0A7W7MMD4_9ACTN|nr:aldo/keto reductase [Actinoplanes lobatus]MBB4755070.1 aryl-alcohol dehydrogenase-like predicted oxidoreductase [Actinoplanes lobatus]GGN82203.1 oxidoreductase [Actinoplanes lobatus]GIE40613.1 oxidoreductase [Actinoplanes lobatus]
MEPLTVTIGGDMPVRRIGYGTMQLTGPGHWGPPTDTGNAIRILRHAVHDLGIDHLDTADAYGPHTVEDLIRQALHPYPDHVVIATKGGMLRPGPNQWTPCGRPEYLRQCVELSLRRLAVDRIDLYYLHRIDPAVPLADQLGTLDDLRKEGKIRHLGLSKVTIDQIEEARGYTAIEAVQNQHSIDTDDPVLGYAEQHGLSYVAHQPFRSGTELVRTSARDRGVRAQSILRLLLRRSPALLTIPGTSSYLHLEENSKVEVAE